jgi:hypothetical protein
MKIFPTCATRLLQNTSFCPISASGSNFNPRNTQCIPVVKIIASLELEQKYAFFKGLATVLQLFNIKEVNVYLSAPY